MAKEPKEPIFSAANEKAAEPPKRLPAAALLFQAPDIVPLPPRERSEPAEEHGEESRSSQRRRRGGRGRRRSSSEETTGTEPGGGDEPVAQSPKADSSEPADPPAPKRKRASSEASGTPEEADTSKGGKSKRGSKAAVEADPAPDAVTEPGAESGEKDKSPKKAAGRSRRKSKETAKSEESAKSAPKDANTVNAQDEEEGPSAETEEVDSDGESSSRRRRRRRTRTVETARTSRSEVSSVEGSTRLEAKRKRRREGREAGRRRQSITESEYLARREAVDRVMLVREQEGLNQIAVLEDNVLVEHYVARRTQTSLVGNVYLGRVQNVLPSMEAAFVDLGKGRNAVLYAGEVNWDAVGLDGEPRRIEDALKAGDQVIVQATKDPIGHKGARLTSQITLAGRHLVLVPSGAMTGISRKLPERERARLKKHLKEIVPAGQGVIVRTAAEGATEEQLRDDVNRLVKIWEEIQKKAKSAKNAPVLLKGEPELAVRVVRDVFNEDFKSLIVSGRDAHATISEYVSELAPDLADRVAHWTDTRDLFSAYRVDEQLAKGMDRKVWLPSGGSLIIERTEAMTVIDVNTGRFTGAGGSLEETVTKNNLEAAEEIVRQLRLRDIGGIIVIDFIDMVLEANRDLVLRRLIECLGRDRTRHQVAEVTSLGLVQMTRKRVGQGLVEAFSEQCETCSGRGFIVHTHPVERSGAAPEAASQAAAPARRGRRAASSAPTPAVDSVEDEASRAAVNATLATIAAAAAASHTGGTAEAASEPGEGGAGQGTERKRKSATRTRAVRKATGKPAADGEAASDSVPAPETEGAGPLETAAGPEPTAPSEPAAGSESTSTPAVASAETGPDAALDAAAAPEAPVSEPRRARGTRRRVVAGGAPSTDPGAGIISLGAGELTLPPARTSTKPAEKATGMLDAIILPEREGPAPESTKKKAPRRATAAAGRPTAENPTSNAPDTPGPAPLAAEHGEASGAVVENTNSEGATAP